MLPFEHALVLLLVTTGLSVLTKWLPWPAPITYVAGGVGFALVPWFPQVSLDPEFFFVCFLPPLLFSDGWLMPLREFVKAKRPIFLLSTGLVVFTTLAVGLVAHAMIPALPLAMAFALGAVVSPTDAVAVGAITERLKIPTRLTIILNGESLMNDATGLVAFKLALAALVAGTFSLRVAAGDFFLLAVGGLALGLGVGYGVGRIRDLIIRARGADKMIEITVSVLTPYAAYLLAGPLHLSGVLSVVAAGLYSGWRDPLRMDAETRQTAFAVWETILFWLNGLAFVLLGLQFPKLLAAVSHLYSPGELAGFAAAVSAAAIAARLVWMFPGAYLPFVVSGRVRRTERRPAWRAVFITGWAGIRGTVTLAAALSIPLALPDGSPFPGRSLVIFLAFSVIAATLLVQGMTLEWLIHRFGLREDPTAADEERVARSAAVQAGLVRLRAFEPAVRPGEETAALGNVLGEYQLRLAELGAQGETSDLARERLSSERRYRFLALEAERAAIDDLWRRDVISDEVHRPLQQLLDHEEGMLRNAAPGRAD